MDAPSRQDVERQLRLVLGSAEFETSPKLSELLYYLVTETLAGNAERLKGYTIGVDVFDRQPDFDQGVDAIVRVQMGRLRKLLKSYYAGSGASDPIRIRLVAGRYAPRFELASGEELSDETLGEPYAPDVFVPPPLSPERPESPPPTGLRALLLRNRAIAVTLAILLLGGLTAATFYVAGHRVGSRADAAVERTRGPLVYVSQYRVIGRGALAGQLAEGLQFDLVNQLAKFPDIAVLGIETVSGTDFNEASAHPEGADFVLGGAVEFNGDTLRITSQLRQASDGRIIWSDQATAHSVEPRTIVSVQADIAATVAGKIGQTYGVISQAMAQQVTTQADPSLEDYRCVLSAYQYIRHRTQPAHLRVRTCLEQVVEHSPKYATAWALLAWVHGDEEAYGFNRVPGETGRQRALRAAERGVAADANNAMAQQHLALARFHFGGDDAGAREAAENALRLSPNNSEVLANAGWIFALLDGDERAHQLSLRAVELNPGHPAWYWTGLAIHALQTGNKAEALKYARLNVSDRGPLEIYLYAAALRLNGRGAEADAEIASLLKSHPEAKDRARMVKSLRLPPRIETLAFGT